MKLFEKQNWIVYFVFFLDWWDSRFIAFGQSGWHNGAFVVWRWIEAIVHCFGACEQSPGDFPRWTNGTKKLQWKHHKFIASSINNLSFQFADRTWWFVLFAMCRAIASNCARRPNSNLLSAHTVGKDFRDVWSCVHFGNRAMCLPRTRVKFNSIHTEYRSQLSTHIQSGWF